MYVKLHSFTLWYITVIWICLEHENHIIQVILRAQELGMVGDDYAWLLFTRHPDEVLPDKRPWLQLSALEIEQGVAVMNLTEEAMDHRRHAFYCLKMVRWLWWPIWRLLKPRGRRYAYILMSLAITPLDSFRSCIKKKLCVVYSFE